MTPYTDFDYLCNEPFYVPNIGNLKCPTLKDIRKITYNIFVLYVNIISSTLEDYLKLCGIEEQYGTLSEGEKDKQSLFYLLLYGNTNVLTGLLSFFIVDEVLFDKNNLSFIVCYGEGENKKQIGCINNDNFDEFRNEVLKILGMKQIETKKPKYKTERARLLAEKIKKAKAQLPKTASYNENMSLDNMIKKYCTHNKVGINILNVWDMTYYQFIHMFNEYCNGRQCDYSDMIAANTFSYKEASDYKSMLWIEKLNNNTD